MKKNFIITLYTPEEYGRNIQVTAFEWLMHVLPWKGKGFTETELQKLAWLSRSPKYKGNELTTLINEVLDSEDPDDVKAAYELIHEYLSSMKLDEVPESA